MTIPESDQPTEPEAIRQYLSLAEESLTHWRAVIANTDPQVIEPLHWSRNVMQSIEDLEAVRVVFLRQPIPPPAADVARGIAAVFTDTLDWLQRRAAGESGAPTDAHESYQIAQIAIERLKAAPASTHSTPTSGTQTEGSKKPGFLLFYGVKLIDERITIVVELPGDVAYETEILPVRESDIGAIKVMYFPDQFLQILVFHQGVGPKLMRIPIEQLPPHKRP